MITSVVMAALFLALGILFSSGRGAFLIAGYNTMSKEEKEQYDTAKLCKFMGKLMFVLSFCVLLWALSELMDIGWLFGAGMALFVAEIIFTLIYANTSDRFKK